MPDTVLAPLAEPFANDIHGGRRAGRERRKQTDPWLISEKRQIAI